MHTKQVSGATHESNFPSQMRNQRTEKLGSVPGHTVPMLGPRLESASDFTAYILNHHDQKSFSRFRKSWDWIIHFQKSLSPSGMVPVP